jgi:hypothetical protein
MSADKQPPEMGQVTIERNSITYRATYIAKDGKKMTVVSEHGSESMQLDGSSPKAVARIILREMIPDGG